MTGEPRWFRSPPAIFALGALAFVVLAELVLGRGGGGTPSDFSLFLGRFHPLVVHLPIGVLVLVGLAEAATFVPRFRPRIDPALGLGLPFVVLVTVTAFVLGHLLGRAGGYAAHALMLHRRLEFLAAVGVCISAALFVRQAAEESNAARTAYRAALGLTLALLSVGAHFGGTVTHGDSYLTEYAPGPMKALLGGSNAAPRASGSAAPRAKAAEPLIFADVVQPILEKYCVDCHGPKKQKGKLRMDSLDALLKGGEEGPALVAGSSATSELVRRVRLPVDDDDRMPPEGKPGPTAEEFAVVAFWIDRGASQTLRVGDTLAPVNSRKLLESTLAAKPKLPGAVTSARPQPGAPDEHAKGTAPAESGEPSAAKAPVDTPGEPKRERAAEPKTDAPDPPSEPSPKAEAAPSSAASGRAVLAERCEKCHGASKKKGGLRVDSLDALLAGGENGPALVPGEPEKSEIIRRLRLPLAQKEHMPPKKEAQPSDAEIQSLAAWVRGLSKSASGGKTKTSGVAKVDAAETKPSAVEASPSSETTEPTTTDGTKPASVAATEPSAAQTNAAPADETPPDAALLARVPERFALYEQAVAPLLKARCSKCHAGEKPAARLRIDDYAALVEGGLSGPGIVPGKPDDSLVCQRIGLPASDEDRMPPEGEPPVTADEVALVRFWVERGASKSLVVASSDVPAAPLRAVAEYAPRGAESPSVHADAGCAACAVGAPASSSRTALALAGVALGAFFARRTRRSRRR